MNFFGIGPMEMGVIAVIALLVFGPAKLPEVMGQAGKAVRDFRAMTANFTGEFEKTMAEAREITGDIQREIGGVTKQVNSVSSSVKKDLAGTKSTTGSKAVKSPVASKSGTAAKTTTSTAAKAGTAAKSTTSAAKTASTTAAKKPAVEMPSKDDPTAGFSLFEPAIVEKPKRVRTASPKAISDILPRDIEHDLEPVAAAYTSADAAASALSDDPLSRARARRRNAGYGRVSA
jgi:TatA/E family protein of Tat protein translocase